MITECLQPAGMPVLSRTRRVSESESESESVHSLDSVQSSLVAVPKKSNEECRPAWSCTGHVVACMLLQEDGVTQITLDDDAERHADAARKWKFVPIQLRLPKVPYGSCGMPEIAGGVVARLVRSLSASTLRHAARLVIPRQLLSGAAQPAHQGCPTGVSLHSLYSGLV